MILSGFRLIPVFLVLQLLLFSYSALSGYGQVKRIEDHFVLKISSQDQGRGIIKQSYFSDEAVILAAKRELNRWTNNGFPFAMVVFDTIREAGFHEIFVSIDPGPPIINGELINHGDTSLKIKMLSRWIRFKNDQPFSLNKFNRIPFILRQMPFAELVGPTKLEWFGERAVIHINVQRRKVNSISGILGILPQAENQGGTIVTGNVDVSLKNLFGQAIGFDLKWNRFAPSSQIANIKLEIPVIGFNGLGVETSFDLFRQDSLLSKQKFDFQLVSNPTGLWQYKLGYLTSSATTRLGIQIGESQSISTNSISVNATFNPFVGSGIVLKKKTLSVSLVPTLKKIVNRTSTVELPQIEANIFAVYPISFSSQRFAVQTSAQISGVWSDQLFVPDQFRAGGLRSIRGFNENFFFTSQHGIFSIQPQFLLDQTLLAFLFSDAMVFNNNLDSKGILNPEIAYSFGIGTEIEIRQNLVQISLANGIQPGVPFDFQTSKIHFGYVARF